MSGVERRIITETLRTAERKLSNSALSTNSRQTYRLAFQDSIFGLKTMSTPAD
jgi:hypothetical protein